MGLGLRASPPGARVAFAALAAALTVVFSALSAAPVRADLGACVTSPPYNLHQKGDEVHSLIWGIFARITTRNPDLCNMPPTTNYSASTAYVMVWKPNVGVDDGWLQVGYVRTQVASIHFYMQYSDGFNYYSDNVSCIVPGDPCVYADAGVTYRHVIKELLDPPAGYYWHVWNANDVYTYELDFTPTTVQYASEAVNQHDQSGGGNASRVHLYTLKWYESISLTVRYPDIQGAERTCDLCGSNGPFNYRWLSGSDFEVWTDGF